MDLFRVKFSCFTRVIESHLSPYLDIRLPSAAASSSLGKILLVDTTSSASPIRDSKWMVRVSRKPSPLF